MVKLQRAWLMAGGTLLTVDASSAKAVTPLAVEVDQPTRARMYLALLAIALLGLLLLVIIRIGAWSFKRKARLDRGPSRVGPKNWAAMRFLKSPLQRSLGTHEDDDADEIIEIDDHQDRRESNDRPNDTPPPL